MVYETLATLPTFLVWIYLFWLVTLVCAEIIGLLEEPRKAKQNNIPTQSTDLCS